MATIRELVIQKALTRLNGGGKPGGVPTTERARTFALEPAQLMSMIIYPVRNPVRNPTTPRRPAVQMAVHFAVEIRSKGDGVNSPDALVDPAIDWAVKALCNSQEPGLWTDVEYEDTEFEWSQLDYAFCLATVRLTALSNMKSNDASALQ